MMGTYAYREGKWLDFQCELVGAITSIRHGREVEISGAEDRTEKTMPTEGSVEK